MIECTRKKNAVLNWNNLLLYRQVNNLADILVTSSLAELVHY
jgi:hypothetical protein